MPAYAQQSESENQRATDFNTVIDAAEQEFIDFHLTAGFGKFREALNLSRGFPDLEHRLNEFALTQAKQWMPDHGWLAKSLLLEIDRPDINAAPPAKLQDAVEVAEHEVIWDKSHPDRPVPDDPIQNKILYDAPASASRVGVPGEAVASSTSGLAYSVVASSHNDAFSHRDETALSLTPTLLTEAGGLKPAFGFATHISERMKTMTTLAFVGLMLVATGVLLYPLMKRASSLNSPVSSRIIASNDLERVAWSAVDRRNVDSIENYLQRFPAGPNRPQAVEALINYRKDRVKAQTNAEVLAIMAEYAGAWRARDVGTILTLENYMTKAEVKAKLLGDWAGEITPDAEPMVEGTRSLVQCRMQIQGKQHAVIFVLSKQHGSWVIEGMRG